MVVPRDPPLELAGEQRVIKGFEDIQKLSKDGVDATVQSLTAASSGAQAIATECADYARKSYEHSSATMEQLLGARSLERAIEIQSAFAKTAYDGFVAQTTKLGALYADSAKQSFKPFEGYSAKLTPTA
jgi:hypothetical protein